ncbi:MAG: ABC transporter ATP-binding protein [Acidobacteria bacterium]|nr:ABC transporter ATP-binding protein [Acidobacteriota bacterium]
MNDPAIRVDALTKSYGPRGLTFSVPRGAICGFLGPNGAGKTTTLRILMGLARAGSGTAAVLGVPAGTSHEIFRRVAFVPEVKDLYPFARAGEMVRLTRGFYPNWDHELERRLVDEFEIPLGMKCGKLSKGVSTKLALLLAVCRRAELLVLDEPTDGLDPIGIEQALRLLVEQVAEHDATVFFSSHQLPEVERIADHLVMIRRGECVAEGGVDELRRRCRRVRCVADGADTALPPPLAGWRRDGRVLTGFSSHEPDTLNSLLAGSGIAVLDSEPATLREIFLERMDAR